METLFNSELFLSRDLLSAAFFIFKHVLNKLVVIIIINSLKFRIIKQLNTFWFLKEEFESQHIYNPSHTAFKNCC